MNERVPSDPHLFRRVARGFMIGVLSLLVLALLVPAPLETAADPAHAPNPARSAWFLLWIQELVGHGTAWMTGVLGLMLGLVTLPWWRRRRFAHARWCRPGERTLAGGLLILLAVVLALTLTARFLRGENWQWYWPF